MGRARPQKFGPLESILETMQPAPSQQEYEILNYDFAPAGSTLEQFVEHTIVQDLTESGGESAHAHTHTH